MAAIRNLTGPKGTRWHAQVRYKGVCRTRSLKRKTGADTWARDIETS